MYDIATGEIIKEVEYDGNMEPENLSDGSGYPPRGI